MKSPMNITSFHLITPARRELTTQYNYKPLVWVPTKSPDDEKRETLVLKNVKSEPRLKVEEASLNSGHVGENVHVCLVMEQVFKGNL